MRGIVGGDFAEFGGETFEFTNASIRFFSVGFSQRAGSVGSGSSSGGEGRSSRFTHPEQASSNISSAACEVTFFAKGLLLLGHPGLFVLQRLPLLHRRVARGLGGGGLVFLLLQRVLGRRQHHGDLLIVPPKPPDQQAKEHHASKDRGGRH